MTATGIPAHKIEHLPKAHPDAPALIRITTETPRNLRILRRILQAAGYWVETTIDPCYSLITYRSACHDVLS